MKPVVSSLVALVIAITPVFAMAAEKSSVEKPQPAKVVKHHKKAEKAKPGIVQVRHNKDAKPEIHRVKATDGVHKGEPKVDHGATLIPATLRTKTPDAPKLPPSSAHKDQKAGSDKGAARKPSKKHDADGNSDGQPERDEEFAELVARIRGHHASKVEPKPEAKKKPCVKDPVEVIRGPEVESIELSMCDGTVAPLALETLSVLVRPMSVPRPTVPFSDLAKKKGPEIAQGIRRVDPGLAQRLQAIADHFGKKGTPEKFDVVSGYRPTSVGSLHQSGRAMDFRLEGVKNEDVVAFCKTLIDTGCGYYPNSSFVHVDVRQEGTGHVSWIDASGPGETPRYVASWPPPANKTSTVDAKDAAGVENTALKELDRDGPVEAIDELPALKP